MRLTKAIIALLIFSVLGLPNVFAQSQTKGITEKKSEVKSVPPAAKNKTAIQSTANQQIIAARKQQIKKAVRSSSISKRPIRRR
ncbi:MAG TPA: hypothetical protein DCG69_02015 [Bacteroidales bacterium]|nr:hypothetical protein [Bacteroidales bacterium]